MNKRCNNIKSLCQRQTSKVLETLEVLFRERFEVPTDMAFLAANSWFLSSQFLYAISSRLDSNRNPMCPTKSNLDIKRHCMFRGSSVFTNSINSTLTLYNYSIAIDMPYHRPTTSKGFLSKLLHTKIITLIFSDLSILQNKKRIS